VRLPYYLLLCLLLPCGAHAEDIGPAQAQNLQQQLQAWLSGLLGPGVTLPALPWQITGEHDHYLITWPISGLDNKPDAVVSASVRPLDAGRWSLDRVTAPAAGTFTITVPDTGKGNPQGPVKVAFSIGSQEIRGMLDPGLTTPSMLHTDLGHLTVATDGPTEHQEQHIDRYLVDTSLMPGRNGRLDLSANATISGWQSAAQMGDGKPIAMAVETLHARGLIEGVDRDRVAGLITALGSFIGALPAEPAPPDHKAPLPPQARAQLRLMIAALQDVLTGVSLQEDLDGLKVEVAGTGGISLQHVRLGLGGEAPEGRLHLWIDLGLDGLDSPTLPPRLVNLLPRHVEIRPSVSGVQTADLRKLLTDASQGDADGASMKPDLMAIFANGGIDVGLEALSFDLGPAKFEGRGKVTVLAPGIWRGRAHVDATGFDELLAQAHNDTDIQQALPILIMLRGLAKPDGTRLVWDIESDGATSVKVNGIDLSQLGSDKPKQKGDQPRRR